MGYGLRCAERPARIHESHKWAAVSLGRGELELVMLLRGAIPN